MRAQLARTPQELEEVLGPIADAGVDVFDGSQRYFDRPEFEGSPLNLGGWAKRITGKAGMTVGGVGLAAAKTIDPAEAAREGRANVYKVASRLRQGEFDLVGVGRALMNDFSWVERLRQDRPFKPLSPEARRVLT